MALTRWDWPVRSATSGCVSRSRLPLFPSTTWIPRRCSLLWPAHLYSRGPAISNPYRRPALQSCCGDCAGHGAPAFRDRQRRASPPALLAFVGVTYLATRLAKVFTLPIVRGIQLGLGLLLAREGLRLVSSPRAMVILGAGRNLAGWEIGLAGATLLIALRGSRRLPAALVLLAAGIAPGLASQWGKLCGAGLGGRRRSPFSTRILAKCVAF